MSDDRNILNFIHTICANGESGRLEILAGAIQGELSFAYGKLVDARVGHLTGFRAINAVAAMRDARFSFDPTFAPIASSSITASERVVLKQFFGIETAATSEYLEPVATVPDVVDNGVDEVTMVDEVTVVRSDMTSTDIPTPPPPPVARFSYGIALALAVLAIAVTAAAAVLINRFYDSRSSKVVVASVESPARRAPVQQPAPAVAETTPARSVPAPAPVKPAPVKEDPKPRNTARDLSGKWNIVNVVETTSYNSFKNMKIGFDLSINQTGTTFTGSGHKVSENGHSLPVSSRTPIQVKGSIKGDTIEATFFEAGTARKSNGRFVWRINNGGRGLNGTFATSAARSSGKSAATRDF
jgi:hypothetical protein